MNADLVPQERGEAVDGSVDQAQRDRQESAKKRLESWDDVRDAFDNLLKRPFHRFKWHRDILERYRDGRLAVHVHISISSGEFCLSALAASKQGRGASDGFVNDNLINIADGENDHSVFVLVYDFMEPPKRLIPSIVRLNRPDYVNRTCGELTILKTLKFVDEPLISGIVEDGEGNPLIPGSRRDFHVTRGEFPNDVIECGAGISDTVTDQNAPSTRGLIGGHWYEHCDGIILVFLQPSGLFVRLHVGADFGLQDIEVLLCPDDFEPGPIE
ncbi:MAG TPA: hypothetical protein VMR66_04360 [Gemmatimonadota bacterium]|nr:hypothetical protein [Gemmatimonadota bacterium]